MVLEFVHTGSFTPEGCVPRADQTLASPDGRLPTEEILVYVRQLYPDSLLQEKSTQPNWQT